jgi:hypothetical protein
MIRDWYLIGVAVIGLGLSGLQLSGWCPSNYERVPNVPPTVRSNPGSYRSHYQVNYMHLGGK